MQLYIDNKNVCVLNCVKMACRQSSPTGNPRFIMNLKIQQMKP